MPSKVKTDTAVVKVKKAVVKKPVILGNKVTPESKINKDAGQASMTRKPAIKVMGLSVPVYSLAGKETGSMELPKEVFGAKVNQALLLQAIRVYNNNERSHNSNTKTRGEVAGSTAKMGAQKGGGRARHGGKRAPIFRGGGIALGPKSRKVELELPQKMRKAALISALSLRMNENSVMGISGLDNSTGKTKEMVNMLSVLDKKNVIMIIADKSEAAQRATKNIKGLHMVLSNQLNAYQIIQHKSVMITKEAATKLAIGEKII